MPFTKYASLEVSEILDTKGTRERAKTANLSKVAEFEDYRTEDGYLYARIRAISSRVNKNNDGWPSVELAGGKECWDRFAAQRESSQGGFVVEADAKQKYGYSTFLGKPVFVDHHNSDPKKARGVIVDAKLHVEDHKTASDLDPYYASAPEEHMPPTWVELLLEIDAKNFPKLAKAIVEGSQDPNKGIDGFSMGCDVERSICSICKNAASSPDEYCNHVKLKGATFDAYDDMGNKTSRKAYEDCEGIRFFEISAVFDPADETALLREIRSSVKKEADIAAMNALVHQIVDEVQAKGQEASVENVLAEAELSYGPQIAQRIQAMIQEKNASVTKQAIDERLERAWVEDGGKFVYEPERTMHYEHHMERNPAPRITCPDCQGKGCSACDGHGDILPGHGQGTNIAELAPQFEIGKGGMLPAVQEVPWGVRRNQGSRVAKTAGPAQFDPVHDRSFIEPQRCEECRRPLKNGLCPVHGGDPYDPNVGIDPQAVSPGRKTPIPIDPYDLGYDSMGYASKTAAGTIPQGDLTTAPEAVDTLRKERVCPVCGQDIDGTECDVCGYEPPPEGLDNPDLSKAQERQERTDEDDILDEVVGPPQEGIEETSPLRARSARLRARNSNQTKKVTSDMAWEPTITPRIAALIQADTEGDEPQEEVVKDESKPTTARKRNQENDMSDTRVAAEPADASGKADKQVDVLGVGGVTDASNDQASTADKQVDVQGKGGTGVEDVSPDEVQDISETADDNAGFDKKKNTQDSGPTKTYPNKNQRSPISDKAFPTAAKKGTDPVDKSGKPDERVDVEQEVNVSWNQSQTGTDQWTGTDGNGVTKQVNPVTPQVGPGNDVRSSAVLYAAFKLADQEVDLGLISKDEKYDRVSELERKSPESLRELQAYISKVKKAGFSRQTREARRVPSLSPKSASAETPEPVDQELNDSALFS